VSHKAAKWASRSQPFTRNPAHICYKRSNLLSHTSEKDSVEVNGIAASTQIIIVEHVALSFPA
jgi:hypothetical protein